MLCFQINHNVIRIQLCVDMQYYYPVGKNNASMTLIFNKCPQS